MRITHIPAGGLPSYRTDNLAASFSVVTTGLPRPPAMIASISRLP